MITRTITKSNFPYILTTPATTYPIDLCLVKAHLKIPEQITSDDAYLNLLIQAVTDYAEKYTKRDFINKTYTTYRDVFTTSITLRKATVSSIVSFEYQLSGVWTALSSDVYGLEVTDSFPLVYLKDGQSWATADSVPQAIKISLVAGYGATANDVPSNVKMGLLNHVALLYENRGDCGCDAASAIPENAKAMYDSIKIMDLGAQSYLSDQVRGNAIVY